jgi:hypothetical protein
VANEQGITVPIILAATGVMAKSKHNNLKRLNLEEDIPNNCQMAAMLVTSHDVHTFLSLK